MEISKTVAAEIRKIKSYEKKAQKLRMEMDLLERQWENRIFSVRTVYPQQWKAHCDANGLYPDYTFSDILC